MVAGVRSGKAGTDSPGVDEVEGLGAAGCPLARDAGTPAGDAGGLGVRGFTQRGIRMSEAKYRRVPSTAEGDNRIARDLGFESADDLRRRLESCCPPADAWRGPPVVCTGPGGDFRQAWPPRVQALVDAADRAINDYDDITGVVENLGMKLRAAVILLVLEKNKVLPPRMTRVELALAIAQALEVGNG